MSDGRTEETTRLLSLKLALVCRAGLSEHQNESALAPYGIPRREWAVAATAERQRRMHNRQTCVKVHRKRTVEVVKVAENGGRKE